MKVGVELQRHVLDELDYEPSVDACQIGVTAREGIVTLTGHVTSYAEKRAAEDVAKRVHGVKAIANEIEVRPGDEHRRDDEDIAAAAVHALEWDAKVPHDRVQVIVQDGWITVEGIVDWRYQKEAIDRAIRHLIGARGVHDNIVVQPGVDSGPAEQTELAEIKGRIEAAIKRSARLNSKDITVEILEGAVTLTGDVHCHAESEEAERTAWAARGVLRVENCLTITPFGEGPAEEWGY